MTFSLHVHVCAETYYTAKIILVKIQGVFHWFSIR